MIAIFDDYIKNEKFLKEIEDNMDDIFKDPGTYKWWGGWWTTPPKNTTQKLIDWVWSDGCPITQKWNIKGFEYWTGIQTCDKTDSKWDNNLIMHVDKDEALWEKTGEIVGPLIGTIYYPPGQDFDGGNLEIFTDGRDNEPEIVKAKDNRLIIFQAGDHYHRVSEVTRGTRKAIAFNLWEGYPTGVESGALIQE